MAVKFVFTLFHGGIGESSHRVPLTSNDRLRRGRLKPKAGRVSDKNLYTSQNAHEWGSADKWPTYTCQGGAIQEERGRPRPQQRPYVAAAEVLSETN